MMPELGAIAVSWHKALKTAGSKFAVLAFARPSSAPRGRWFTAPHVHAGPAVFCVWKHKRQKSNCEASALPMYMNDPAPG